MTQSLEYSIDVRATPAVLFDVYSEVGRWHEWDPDTQSAQLHGPLQVGAIGRLKPRKGMTVKMRVVALDPGRRFLVECPVLGSTMRFDHLIEPIPDADGRVRVTHKVTFEGWLAGFLYRVVGKDLHNGLPTTLKQLKIYVESR
jgi:hypothetical protein